jgi:crotonobetainyl-CoA:carnitine CoA-transferase CaiB-like acyl-CoA transferase
MPNLIGREAFASGSALARAPGLGEHGTAILAEHGYSGAEIAALAAAGVILGG